MVLWGLLYNPVCCFSLLFHLHGCFQPLELLLLLLLPVGCVHQMWQRGRAMSKRDWTLLRVAVVACVNDVYFGRLFFGDPDTQQVLWDTDVRPSDATFLALKVCGGSERSDSVLLVQSLGAACAI